MFSKVGTPRCGVRTAQRAAPTMELQTPRLILRSFREEDVDAMAQLFANPDFMRFSLGVFTERKKQTVAFIEKVMGWDRASMPSQLAVVLRGYDAVILIRPENIPSRRVAVKNGRKMEKATTFRGFPTLVHAITREEWLANPDAS